MSKPQAPTPPNPAVVDAAATASNDATALYQSQLNNGNSTGPNGSVTNSYDPTSNQWTQNTTLSPAQQAIYNGQTSAESSALGIANNQLGNVQTALNTPLSVPQMETGVGTGGITSGYGSGGAITNSFNPGQTVQGQVSQQTGYNPGGAIQGQVQGTGADAGAIQNAEMANFAGQMQLLAPQMQQASEQNNASLIAQGLNPNSAAYQNEDTLFGNQQATQLGQAASSAVAAGNAEQNTLYGQNLASGDFANSAQSQQNTQNANAAGLYNSSNLAAGNFNNSAAAQQYAQNEGQAAFSNAAQAQGNTQNQQAAAFQNTAQAQQNAEAMANASLNNQAQQADFTNSAYAQSLPINEFNSLMSSGQVTSPTAANLSATGVSPTNVLGAYALQSQVAQSDYASQMAQQQAGLGGLFNLGSAALKLA